jgi:hypothetical protein
MTRARAYLIVALTLTLIALSGCHQEPDPAYCYRQEPGNVSSAWYCEPGAEYPRDTLPDAMKGAQP